MQTKIVITGGSGPVKSTLIKEFVKRNFMCMPEITRESNHNARQNGTVQLFLPKPL